MNFCPNCGTKLTDGINYCPSCGFVFPETNRTGFAGEENVSSSYEKASSALNEEAENTARERTEQSTRYSYSDTGNRGTGSSFSGRTGQNYNNGYMETAPKTNVYGILSLVCGILGFPLFFLLLIPNILAVVFGILGLVFAKNHVSSKVTSIIGLILGIVSILLFILGVLFSVAIFSVVAENGAAYTALLPFWTR